MADAVVELNAFALLDDVRRFVRGQPEVWRRSKTDVIADGVADRSHSLIRVGGRATDLRLDAANVARAK
jgi:hypothetical protein